ncbi:MAG: substrate-binding periplasmic protein [Sphingomonadaceae bacterium]
MIRLVTLLTLTLLLGAPAGAQQLVFAVSTGGAMPMSAFRDGTLSGGLLKAFGDALAQELHMSPRYLLVPRKRVEEPLLAGQADLLCDLRPEWVSRRDWLWSETVFSNTQIIASRADTPAVERLAQLDRQRIGTILGYYYPQLEQALGEPLAQHFLRDDALGEDANLAKLLRKRFPYIVTNALYFDYQLKIHPERGRLNRARYPVMSFDTYCALPARGKLELSTLNRAIQAMKRRGEIQAMLARFRPAELRAP